MKSKIVLAFVFLVAGFQTASARNFFIDSRIAPYNSIAAAQDITIFSEVDLRIASMLSQVGAAKTINGPFSPVIRVGDRFTVIYPDGSSEEGIRVCLAGSACVVPVAGTRKNANGSSADGGGGGGGGGGGIDIIGSPIHTGTVIVEPIITMEP